MDGVHLDDGDDLKVVVGEQLVVLGHLRPLQQLLEDGLVLLRPLPSQLLDDEPRRMTAHARTHTRTTPHTHTRQSIHSKWRERRPMDNNKNNTAGGRRVLGDLGVGLDEELLEERDAADGFEGLVLLGALVDDHHQGRHLGVVDRIDEVRPATMTTTEKQSSNSETTPRSC